MLYSLAADLTLFLHLVFIIYVCIGAVLVLKWSRSVWLHLTALAWGIIVEWQGIICPLTPLENCFRQQAGQQGYSETFIERYLLPLIYPNELTSEMQQALAVCLLIVNLLLYFLVWHSWRKKKQVV